jgi:hypothetical protein
MDQPAPEYESPQLKELGTLASMTLGNSWGAHLDANFISGTSRGDLTFS